MCCPIQVGLNHSPSIGLNFNFNLQYFRFTATLLQLMATPWQRCHPLDLPCLSTLWPSRSAGLLCFWLAHCSQIAWYEAYIVRCQNYSYQAGLSIFYLCISLLKKWLICCFKIVIPKNYPSAKFVACTSLKNSSKTLRFLLHSSKTHLNQSGVWSTSKYHCQKHLEKESCKKSLYIPLLAFCLKKDEF